MLLPPPSSNSDYNLLASAPSHNSAAPSHARSNQTSKTPATSLLRTLRKPLMLGTLKERMEEFMYHFLDDESLDLGMEEGKGEVEHGEEDVEADPKSYVLCEKTRMAV
jgi:hypothetical protein